MAIEPGIREGEPEASEKWVTLDNESLDFINSGARDQGQPKEIRCFDRGLMLFNVGEARLAQIITALKFSTKKALLEKNVITNGVVKIDDSAVSFFLVPEEDGTETVTKINKIVDDVNDIMKTFEKPKIPSFTLK